MQKLRNDARVLVTTDETVGTLLAICDDDGAEQAYGLEDWRAECSASFGFDGNDLRRYAADGRRFYGQAIGFYEGTEADLVGTAWEQEDGVFCRSDA